VDTTLAGEFQGRGPYGVGQRLSDDPGGGSVKETMVSGICWTKEEVSVGQGRNEDAEPHFAQHTHAVYIADNLADLW
jgi:hypothetical protein